MGKVREEKKKIILQPQFHKQNMAVCKQADTAASPYPSTVSHIPQMTTIDFWRLILWELSRALDRAIY